jgi:uncharacterized protein
VDERKGEVVQATENGAPRTRKAILSIDGGGIRGAIPAVVLREIEDRAKTPICELFDVIAGTSTGGILALGLTCPGEGGGPRYTAAELLGMYEDEGRKIFPGEPFGAIRQVFGPKYPSFGRRRVLRERFEDTRLSEALTEVIVTAYDLEGRKPVFFRRADARTVPRDFLMSDVAMATSAAPTYFKPVKLADPAQGGRSMALVDGGVFANNPAMCALVDRTSVDGESDDAFLVSLGTGATFPRRYPYRSARNWGLFGWGRCIIKVVFDGIAESVEYELSRMLSEYHRLDLRLSNAAQEPMDRPRNVGMLIGLGEELVKVRSAQIDFIVAKLLGRKPVSPRSPRAPATP